MAFMQFDLPLYAHRRHFVQEITCLDDVFEFIDEWPQVDRGVTYDAISRMCRRAGNGEVPAAVVRENFRRFLKQNGKLVERTDSHCA